MKTAKRTLKRLLVRALAGHPSLSIDEYTYPSWSQSGEDRILDWLFGGRHTGFFVDIGAHHPQRYSNTYMLYLKGWRGINVDAMPGSMEPFRRVRPNDINLEIGISRQRQTLTYYSFDDPALNGFSPELAEERRKWNPDKVVAEHQIQTFPLSEVLDKHVPSGTEIDLLSVDVEGLDYEVLSSNDWDRYRPKVVIVEDLDFSIDGGSSTSEAVAILRSHGYVAASKTAHNVFMVQPGVLEHV